MPRTCAACNKRALLRCPGCFDIPGQPDNEDAPWYCSTVCQMAHKKEHERNCREQEKALRRAADIVKAVWLMFVDNTFDYHVHWTCLQADGSLLIAFGFRPDFDIGKLDRSNIHTLQHVEVVFAKNTCTASLRYMNIVPKVEIRELMFLMKESEGTPRRRVAVDLFLPDPSTYLDKNKTLNTIPHSIFTVRLRSGQLFAIDLTSAQYGYYGESAVPWSEYQHRVKKQLMSWPLHHAACEPSRGNRVKELQDEVNREMDRALAIWQNVGDNTKIRDLVKVTHTEEYEGIRSDLLNALERGVQNSVQRLWREFASPGSDSLGSDSFGSDSFGSQESSEDVSDLEEGEILE